MCHLKKYLGLKMHYQDNLDNLIEISSHEEEKELDKLIKNEPANLYQKPFTNRMKQNQTCDVYDVLNMFEVTCPMKQHAIKKLLVTGNRLGNKNETQDLEEARWSIDEAVKEKGK